MKNTKRYLSVLLILCMMFCSTISFAVEDVTLDSEIEVTVDLEMKVIPKENSGEEEELMPMAAYLWILAFA
mgnify:CR=1 FL=1